MITMCKILPYFVKFVNSFLLVKKGSSGKTFIYPFKRRLVLLHWTKGYVSYMAICLRHVKTIACDRFFFTDFVSIHSEGG